MRDKIMETLDMMQFFGGQRAGRELWTNKPTDVQDADIESFNKNIEAIRDYINQLERITFDQNMVILGKQDVITKQERVRADLLSEIFQLRQQVPRWISVEERLPEDCKHVLVFMWRNVVPGWSVDYWHIDTDWLDDGNWSKNPTGGYFNITHWMPLPEPPKEAQP